MNRTPFPGYENHINSYLRDEIGDEARKINGAAMMSYTKPEGMKIETISIDSSVPGDKMEIRIFTPANLPAKAPMVLDVHGGGFVAGNLDIDNGRCIAIATRVECIVVSVAYHLASKEHHFPTPVLDAYAAYVWMQKNAESLGADGTKIGLHGSSAGGTICEGLALYLRDHGEQQPCLTVLNCACYSNALQEQMSFQQNFDLRMGPDCKAEGAEPSYLGCYNGTLPSYYAFPAYCNDVGGLGAHFIITAEYDTLRDGGFDYARRLLNAAVPCEMLLAPRVAHCFTACPAPYTDQIHDLMATSYRREFGML